MKPISILLVAAGLSRIAQALPIQVDPAGNPFAGTFAVEWQTAANFEGWTTSQTTAATVSAGKLTGMSSGADPQVIRANFPGGPDLDLGFNDYLETRIQVPAGYPGDIQIFYGTTGTTGFSASRVITIPAATIPKDGAFHTYRIDVGPEPWWRGTLRDLRIDPVSTSGQAFAIDYLRVGDLPGDVYLPNTTDQPVTAYELSSKHFRFIWNATRATTNGINTTIARGTLRNAEEAWQTYVKLLGYREPAESMNPATRNGNKYKTNFLCTNDGFWMSGSPTSFGYLNIDPSGLQVDPPSWVTPHELMHVFQMHNDGGHMPGEWWETHANYGRERWLYHYAGLYPNDSNIEAQAVRDSHFMMCSGRNYYLTWPFFLYLDENPDALPDLYDGIVAKVWQETQANEFPTTALDRLTPVTSLKDIVGYYARRGATFDYSHQSAITSKLNGQDATRNARHVFTDLVQRADAPGWWRVPMDKAPAQGAYAIHELVPAGSGAGRVVTVNLHGLADAARGADWRASFIAVSDTGLERYTPLWSSGNSSITLAANENKLYLSVAGTPDLFYYGGHDEAVYPYRSHPSRSRFHYEVQVTGATPRERTNGATTGLIQHANGGGWKASTATVDATAFIGPNARVLGTAKVRNKARVEDFAIVQDSAQVINNAIVSGHAWVRDTAIVSEYGRVRDWAIVDSGTISGNGRVLEHATVGGNVTNTATAKGSAISSGGTLSGNAVVDGDYSLDKSLSNGVTIGHLPYVGIPDSFTKATSAGLYAAYDFATPHDSRILDPFGVTDGYAIGSPTWISADARRKGFLQFSGTDQYAVLDRSVADTRAFTFTAWVKPLGGNANQAVLWLGATPSRRLVFTADDGTGHAKFAIANGGADQTLIAPSALPSAIWSHVAITLDGTNGTLHVNGTAVASAPVSIVPDQLLAANTASAAQHNYLARAEGSAMPMFRGALDDVKFFTTALSAADIAAMQPATTLASSGALLVNLSATDSTAGTATWTNNGTLGGAFTRNGTPAKVANVLSSGIPGVQFNGSSGAYTGPPSTTDIDGASDRSVEVWAWNPSLSDEETTVSWGHRGFVLQDMAFNFGSNTEWGAATHWGDDAGWGTAPPSAGGWHHLVYTYSANVVRLYIDGAPANSKTLGGPLNTFAGEPINIACQRESANGTRSKWFGGYLNAVRIHGGVLSDQQIAGNASLGPAGAPLNAAPSITGLTDRTIDPGGSASIPFTVSDPDTPVSGLTVTASSSNGTLVPAANLSVTGGGSPRTLQIAAASGLNGSSNISIQVADGVLASSASFTLTVPTAAPDPATFGGWQAATWPGNNAPDIIAPDADPDSDGLKNLLEWALHLDPNTPGVFKPVTTRNATHIEYTYTRRKTAAASYQLEWSNTLGNDWSTLGIASDPPVETSPTSESVRCTVPISTGNNQFLRLRVTLPQ